MISISMQYFGLDNAEGLDAGAFSDRLEVTGTAVKASEQTIVDWSGPALKIGMFESIVEWIAKIDISSVIPDVASTLIANYLWELITTGRKKPSEKKGGNRNNLPAFQRAVKVKMVISKREKSIEIDAAKIDRETLLRTLQQVLDDGDHR